MTEFMVIVFKYLVTGWVLMIPLAILAIVLESVFDGRSDKPRFKRGFS